MNVILKNSLLFFIFLSLLQVGTAQPVTGVWRGKIAKGNSLGRQSYKLELKLVKNGDSLTGTSYYYASPNNYFRYSVKGFFGTRDNSINWWDDQLIESHSPNIKLGNSNSQPMLTTADYNCPGSGVMLLNGNTHPTQGGPNYELHLQKYENPDFKDEWDPIIEDYFVGGADPYLIDSVGKIAFTKPIPAPIISQPEPAPQRETTVYQPPKKENKPVEKSRPEPAKTVVEQIPEPKPLPKKTEPIITQPEPVIVKAPPTIEEKFAQRKTALTTIIPVSGDSIEFKFYDNAEVDGDSISIFLNSKLIRTHIRLTDKGYSVKIPATDLQAENELVMVAENLGSIPPNTAYMEAWSGGQRYAARLESTENSSAMIKLKKE